MRKKKTKKESGQATRASVQEEMAKPRLAKSAREEVLKNLRKSTARETELG